MKTTVRSLNQLRGMNIVVYDLEIKECIGEGPNPIGWNDHDKMGISVGCIYDYEDGDFKIYMDDNMPALCERLNRADLVVAFNHLAFDNKLVRACGHGLKPDEELPNYDMLVEVRKGYMLKNNRVASGGFKLDNILAGTFGRRLMKTANGAEAPRMYKRGAIGELVTYNVADVRREKMAFEHAWLFSKLISDVNGEVPVEHPEDFMASFLAKRQAKQQATV